MKDQFRKSKDIEIMQCYVYKGITGLNIMHIEIYDKLLKKMFIANIQPSSWSYKEKKILLKRR